MVPPESHDDEEQLTIPASQQPLTLSRSLDSLGPSRSLPARPTAPASSPLALIATAVSTLAALVLFTLPSTRGGQPPRALLAQTLARLTQDGLPLRDVRCPPADQLAAGRPFSCEALAGETALRIQLTPSASRAHGAIDRLHVHVEGALSVVDVTQLAAERFAARAQVTCPHRYWVDQPGAQEQCTLRVGREQGPLTVVSSADGSTAALSAPWLDARLSTAAK